MTLIAFDLGQTIGYIKGSVTGPLEHGEWELPKTTDLGRWVAGSDNLLRKVLPGCTAIGMEQPFLGQSYFPARKLLALLGHIYYTASFYGIGGNQISEIPIATGKLNLAGHGNATAEQMIAAALERYDMVLGEHEAHALGIFDVYVFGRVAPAAKRPRSSKGVIVT